MWQRLRPEPISDKELADEVERQTAPSDRKGDWLFSLEWKQKIIADRARRAIYYRRGPIPRIVLSIVVCFGFVVRWTFFAASGLAVFVYCAEADWSAFNTRFADLTIAKVIQALLRLSVVGFLAWALWKWAFDSGKTKTEHYVAWAYLAFYGFLACLILYRLIFH